MAAMDNVSMEQEIIKIIEEVLKHKITKEMLTMELYSIGIDSIRIIQIVVDIEEKYNIKLGKVFEDDTMFENLQVFVNNVVNEVRILSQGDVL